MEKRTDNNNIIIGVIIIAAVLLLLSWTAIGQTIRSMFTGNDTATTTVNVYQNPTSTTDMRNTNQNNNNNSTASTTASSTTTVDENAVAFRVKVSDLPTEQQSVVRASGFTGEEIEITNGMKMCAEQSIGAERTAAIASGTKATASESIKLAACYVK